MKNYDTLQKKRNLLISLSDVFFAINDFFDEIHYHVTMLQRFTYPQSDPLIRPGNKIFGTFRVDFAWTTISGSSFCANSKNDIRFRGLILNFLLSTILFSKIGYFTNIWLGQNPCNHFPRMKYLIESPLELYKTLEIVVL